MKIIMMIIVMNYATAVAARSFCLMTSREKSH